jgi:hypothetical protein
MISHEEAKILRYLRQHFTAHTSALVKNCLPGTPRDWVNRIIADLEWLGYVTVYYSANGNPLTLEITDKGLRGVGPAGQLAL